LVLSPQPTTGPIEFRLYGWNAATATDNTHLVGASMRARFASVVGVPIDPTGSIAVQGDFYHLPGAQIAIDLGGQTGGVDYDQINVTGKVELAGDLTVLLANVGESPFAPLLNDSFEILTATQGITGQFANVTLPALPWNLDWRIDYLPSSVLLTAYVSGDFNKNCIVDAADYAVWRKNSGTQTAYDAWRANFGKIVATGSGSAANLTAAIPEPASLVMLFLCVTISYLRRSRTVH
jgi:hypothetical protein